MAGGKKKSLANKLAKMSDEERARYLQHKADMEEEAKRRKEQLIATFMKKKIKKEDAFSRLNLAKINQNWHQILRKAKCQEMKEDVGHLKQWIERLLTFKNRTISKLMDELEEAEEQYSHNFQYHSSHIDSIIETQHEYIEKLQRQYDEDLCELLEKTYEENELISTNARSEQEHLMTILYAQEINGEKNYREQYESNMVKLFNDQYNFDQRALGLLRSREMISEALWRQIASVVKLYVQQTDSRRMHLAELHRLDAASAIDIAKNEEHIRHQEALIVRLQKTHDDMIPEREQHIKALETELYSLRKAFQAERKTTQKDLQTDERKLNLLAECAASSLQYLEKQAKKGDQLKYLANACKKFETEREKISKYLPVSSITKYEGDDDDDDFIETVKIVSEELKDIGNVDHTLLSDSCPPCQQRRPKTSVSDSLITPESRRITTVNSVMIHSKISPLYSSTPSSSSKRSSKNFLERCFDSLKNMENFWFTFNKMEIDYVEIKEEKKVLEEENKRLRGAIRAVLEAAALAQTVPNSRVSTRLPSRMRVTRSAPLRRMVFN